MNTDLLSKQAVAAALAKQWDRAVIVNKEILAEEPGDVAALNRLGRAYHALGDKKKAQKYYHAALKQDPNNQITQKNLAALNTNAKRLPTSISTFIKDPSTTISASFTVTSLVQAKRLTTGDELKINIRKKAVQILNQKGTVIGESAGLGEKLYHLRKRGIKLQAFMVGLKGDQVSAIIRASQPAFKSEIDYRPYLRPEDIERIDADL